MKNKVRDLLRQISEAQKAIEQIQHECKHEHTFELEGQRDVLTVCTDCEKVISSRAKTNEIVVYPWYYNTPWYTNTIQLNTIDNHTPVVDYPQPFEITWQSNLGDGSNFCFGDESN